MSNSFYSRLRRQCSDTRTLFSALSIWDDLEGSNLPQMHYFTFYSSSSSSLTEECSSVQVHPSLLQSFLWWGGSRCLCWLLIKGCTLAWPLCHLDMCLLGESRSGRHPCLSLPVCNYCLIYSRRSLLPNWCPVSHYIQCSRAAVHLLILASSCSSKPTACSPTWIQMWPTMLNIITK